MSKRGGPCVPAPHANVSGTVLSMVPLPTVIDACRSVFTKTEDAICELRTTCLQEASNCIAAVKDLSTSIVKTNDVEILKADLTAVSVKLNDVSTDICALRSSFESLKSEVANLIQSVGSSPLQCRLPNDEGETADNVPGQTAKVLFLTVKHDGEEHNLYLPRSTRDILLGCIKKRDAVRRLLLNFHSIPDLRRFTLTGESSYEKTRLPPLHVKFAEAAVLKFFEPNKALKTIVNDDGTTKFDEEIKSLKAEVRSLITSILEYYFKRYNADGTKIPEKKPTGRKRKTPDDDVGVEID